MTRPANIVGLGELLWDLLPSGKQLGGAPANFAYMANVLGDRGIVASRIGADPLGREALDTMTTLGITTDFIQQDEARPTGTVHVRVDAAGQPEFTIHTSVAWDALEFTQQWADLAKSSDVVCFGSLAQRAQASRATIRQFVQATPAAALRIFDVNLRHTFFTKDILHECLQLSHVVKLNHQELPRIADLLALGGGGEGERAQRLLDAYRLRLVCITRGENGSLLVGDGQRSSHKGFRVQVADAVGAGDAFTACLAHQYLRGASLDEINEKANRWAAWVATQVGATPSTAGRDPEEIMAKIST